MMSGERLAQQLLWWLWIPAVYGFIWLVLHGVAEGMDWKQRFDQAVMANFWSASVLFFIWLTIGLLGSLMDWGEEVPGSKATTVAGVILALATLGSAAGIWIVAWDNDKDYERYYNRSVVFEAPDLDNPPDSLTRLVATAKDSPRERCDKVGTADVTSCLREGSLAKSGWAPRIASLDAAEFAIRRKSADIQKVSLSEDTLAYLNAAGGKQARWSGVLDGSGINQAMGGIAEWDGRGEPTTCLFKGDYAIDRAFAGGRSNNLPNLLAERYATMRWDIDDVWGYCEGDKPVVVVPMTKQVYFKNRTVDTAAGVVVVEGDHGRTKLTHRSIVKPGSLPGPVYPGTLVAIQRNAATWAAGRENQNRNGFGFDPVSSEVQAGNASEHLLLNKATNRLEWVTPVRLRNSTSELIVAYEITPADTVTNGKLNTLRVSVLDSGDKRRVNIDTLEARSRDHIGREVPGFFSSGGVLREFIPIDGDIWRAYGERQGSVVYQLDISSSNKAVPRLLSLDADGEPNTGQEPGEPSGPPRAGCASEMSKLTNEQLATCAKQFIDEMSKRKERNR